MLSTDRSKGYVHNAVTRKEYDANVSMYESRVLVVLFILEARRWEGERISRD